ncbi:MAG: hypothetical protein AUG88_00500 [Actinobacteria bacterium 13_1_20CM_4_68_12]|nr:MAG: hypothetical protein AUG88_00500 [Actinobacteria bacterium 13_1_20CM_4_68_12]
MLNEEWIAFCRGDDPGPRVVGYRSVAKEVLDDEAALLFGQRLQLHDRAAVLPLRTMLEQVRSSGTEEEKRRV